MSDKKSKVTPEVGDSMGYIIGKYHTDYMIHHHNSDVVEVISYDQQEQLKLDGYEQLTDEQRKTILPQKSKPDDQGAVFVKIDPEKIIFNHKITHGNPIYNKKSSCL